MPKISKYARLYEIWRVVSFKSRHQRRLLVLLALPALAGCGTSSANGSELTRLTDNPGPDEDPVWSPDGQWIAFVSAQNLYTMRPNGSDVAPLTKSKIEARYPAWSPDGRYLAYLVAGDLVIIDL